MTRDWNSLADFADGKEVFYYTNDLNPVLRIYLFNQKNKNKNKTEVIVIINPYTQDGI